MVEKKSIMMGLTAHGMVSALLLYREQHVVEGGPLGDDVGFPSKGLQPHGRGPAAWPAPPQRRRPPRRAAGSGSGQAEYGNAVVPARRGPPFPVQGQTWAEYFFIIPRPGRNGKRPARNKMKPASRHRKTPAPRPKAETRGGLDDIIKGFRLPLPVREPDATARRWCPPFSGCPR